MEFWKKKPKPSEPTSVLIVTEEAITIIETPKPIVKTNAQIIEEIHNEFDVCWEGLLKDAKDILAKEQDEYLVKKSERLKSLGFSSTKVVKSTDEETETRDAAKIKADLIEYYRIKYPLYKFIDEESVGKICEKYGLVKGKVSWYTGNVPEKNLQDIERFSIKDEDCGYVDIFNSGIGSLETDCGFKKHEEYLDDQKNNFRIHMFGYSTIKKKPLSIVAPVKEFDTEKFNLEKIGYTLNRVIEDPVVLHPVVGGYLIVTAWGDEAGDELVVNEINN